MQSDEITYLNSNVIKLNISILDGKNTHFSPCFEPVCNSLLRTTYGQNGHQLFTVLKAAFPQTHHRISEYTLWLML